MFQFTAQQLDHLREKVAREPHWLEPLKAQCAAVLDRPLLVPTEGVANWNLYYYCPHCSVQLIYDPSQPYAHTCPQCGEVFRGEPYDSSWWCYVNQENFGACYAMALLYQLTGEERYGRKAVELLDRYACNYPDYKEHGDIPYNGPGRAAAQTLDESFFLMSFAKSYDLLTDLLTERQAARIRDDMLLPGAEFLMRHRVNQIHNHEIMVNTGIAIIGILFGNERLIRFAVDEPYGLRYQLEQGMLSDHMWFERAMGYHFASLHVLMEFEKFAVNTPYSMLDHPNYKVMLELPLQYVRADGKLPYLGDTNPSHGGWEMCGFYEFAYSQRPTPGVLQVLQLKYRTEPRNGLEALLYGVDELPEAEPLSIDNYHDATGSGSTVLRRADGTYLFFKHDCYGGEHDHYDRLGISYEPFGRRVSPDLGTVGYGAVLHYDYFKNTGTHNLVTVNGRNQPPARGRLVRYEENARGVSVTAETDWCTPYRMPDSFTIVQWDEDAYRGVKMRRSLLMGEDFLAEVFTAESTDGTDRTFDWNMHFCGEHLTRSGSPVERFSDEKPYCHWSEVLCESGSARRDDVFLCDGVTTRLYSCCGGAAFYSAVAPDNPTYIRLSRVTQRVRGSRAVFAHLLHSYKDAPTLVEVEMKQEDGGIRFTLQRTDGSTDSFVWNGVF